MKTNVKFDLNGETVFLDSESYTFTEATVNEFLQKIAPLYGYYSAKHTEAISGWTLMNDLYDAKFSEKYAEIKDQGNTEKRAEAGAKIHPEVIEVLDKVRLAKQKVNYLAGFLRAIDYSKDAALNLCYNIRKEMNMVKGNYVNE
jgi:hypothetical protein